LHSLIPIVLGEVSQNQGFGRRLTKRLSLEGCSASLGSEGVMSRSCHGAASCFESLDTKQSEGVVGPHHPLLMPARKDVARQKRDLAERETITRQGAFRRSACPMEVDIGINCEFIAD
jgi:hypothetical protein